jgi:O-antigen/teichoic acid export membrane protein
MLVPITIDYLDVVNYGVWLTISSFISWFSFFDIGLGNGLRNKFTESVVNKDYNLAKGYVSTAYFSIGIFSSIFLLIFFIINYYIDWTIVFNTTTDLFSELKLLLPIIFTFFFIQLVLKLIVTIHLANQDHSFQAKIHFISTFLSLILVWILTKIQSNSFIKFGFFYSLLPVLILVISNIISFNGNYKFAKPSLRFFKKEYFDSIFGLGIKFFVIQLSGLILFSTDNFLITQIFSPEDVVPYNISHKYIGISLMIFNIFIAPFWSSVTEAYSLKDFQWIKTSMNYLLVTIIIFILFLIVLNIFSQFAYNFWIGDKIIVDNSLTLLMVIYFALTIIYTPFTYFINGIGKINIQMFSVLIMAILNIPLSIFLAKYLNYGVDGIIYSTIICIIPHTVLSVVQYYLIINNKASGIWLK